MIYPNRVGYINNQLQVGEMYMLFGPLRGDWIPYGTSLNRFIYLGRGDMPSRIRDVTIENAYVFYHIESNKKAFSKKVTL